MLLSHGKSWWVGFGVGQIPWFSKQGEKNTQQKNMTFNMTGFTAFKMTVVSKSSN